MSKERPTAKEQDMTPPHADDLIAAHEIDYTDHDTYVCSGGDFSSDNSAAAGEHAREHGLCGQCFGTGEGPGPFYGGDDSGIGPCDGCRGGRTAEAEDAVAKAAEELDAMMTAQEQVAQSGLFERETPEV
jgi:hypothetical protein